MKRLVRWLAGLGLLLFLVVAVEVFLLCNPSPLFAWTVRAGDLALYSDRPFTPAEGRAVLELVEARLRTSAYFKPGVRHTAYLCNARWRRLIFCVGDYRAGGLNYAPLTRNVFLSGGDVAANRLVSPGGSVVPGEMTLSYFIAHEVTHSLLQEHLGVRAYFRTPFWLREAYCDYVARGSVFPRPEARSAYLAGERAMYWPAPAPYLRYNILFGQLVEREGLAPEEIFRRRITRADAERRLRAYLASLPPAQK